MGRGGASPAGFADVPQSHPLLGVGGGDESGLHRVEHDAVEGRRVAGQAERLCRDMSRRQAEQEHTHTHTCQSRDQEAETSTEVVRSDRHYSVSPH